MSSSPVVPPSPRYVQAEDAIEQIRKQVLALSRCDQVDLRRQFAADIVDELCEIEHLLEIHKGQLTDRPT